MNKISSLASDNDFSYSEQYFTTSKCTQDTCKEEAKFQINYPRAAKTMQNAENFRVFYSMI